MNRSELINKISFKCSILKKDLVKSIAIIYEMFFQIDMEVNHADHGDALVDRNLLDSFVDLHRSQLELSGVPRIFHPTLFHKLQNQVNFIGIKSVIVYMTNRSLTPVNILVSLK